MHDMPRKLTLMESYLVRPITYMYRLTLVYRVGFSLGWPSKNSSPPPPHISNGASLTPERLNDVTVFFCQSKTWQCYHGLRTKKLQHNSSTTTMQTA